MQVREDSDVRSVNVQLGDCGLELRVPASDSDEDSERLSHVNFTKNGSGRLLDQDLPLLARVMTLSNDLREHGRVHKTPWVRHSQLRQR